MRRHATALAVICAFLGLQCASAQTPASSQTPVSSQTFALAQTQGNATAGAEVARRWCANCHLVESGQRSGSDAAPPFASIARKPTTTAASLTAFLHMPHFTTRMPDFHLSQVDIDNVVAYLLSQRH